MSMQSDGNNSNNNTKIELLHIGQYEVFFKKGYKIIHTINDFLIGFWFLIGSIFFFFDRFQTAGTWLFVIGSAELLIRPTIKLIHDFHLKRVINKNEETNRNL